MIEILDSLLFKSLDLLYFFVFILNSLFVGVLGREEYLLTLDI